MVATRIAVFVSEEEPERLTSAATSIWIVIDLFYRIPRLHWYKWGWKTATIWK